MDPKQIKRGDDTMKGASKLRERTLALLMAICMAMAIPAAYAVVKNISIVNSQGTALANTKVTIVFPDGTEVDEETDDRGMLIYDFPGDGDYMVNFPGGQIAVNVSGGISTWQWVAGGAVAAAMVTAVVVANNNSSSNNNGSSGGSSGGSGGTDTCPSKGAFTVSTSVVSNPGNHPPTEFDGLWDISCSAGQANVIFSGSASVNFACTVDSSGNCDAGATDCSYAGIPTTCSLSSTFSGSSWTGQMSAGLDGALPPGSGSGQPIVVSFTGN